MKLSLVLIVLPALSACASGPCSGRLTPINFLTHRMGIRGDVTSGVPRKAESPPTRVGIHR